PLLHMRLLLQLLAQQVQPAAAGVAVDAAAAPAADAVAACRAFVFLLRARLPWVLRLELLRGISCAMTCLQ
ncbi:MAG: hypothetical protein ACKPKO_18800, partial [Candidatus Fonsibacter sp.]